MAGQVLVAVLHVSYCIPAEALLPAVAPFTLRLGLHHTATLGACRIPTASLHETLAAGTFLSCHTLHIGYGTAQTELLVVEGFLLIVTSKVAHSLGTGSPRSIIAVGARS